MGLTQYLREHPPEGQIFNPMAWGDWIVHDGPPGILPFLTSNVHLVPNHVWRDYLGIMNTRPGWQQALGKYGVETVVVDRKEMYEIDRALRRDTERWRLVYQDDLAAVFAARKSAPAPPSKPSSHSAPPRTANLARNKPEAKCSVCTGAVFQITSASSPMRQ